MVDYPMKKSGQGRVAVYPGTFDPVTNGHVSLIERALHLFDNLIVAVARNSGKSTMFSYDERSAMMTEVVTRLDDGARVRVTGFDGLLANFAKEEGASAIIRGLRAVSDFEYEFQMALMNRKLARSVETVFLMPALSWVYLSSSLVKDVAAHGGEIEDLVPEAVKRAFEKKRTG